ncbi:MAG TPA: outer membrane beta-barrel protein [Steroidobacteraceae bacterium]
MVTMRRGTMGVLLAFCAPAFGEAPDFRMTTDTPITRDSPNSVDVFIADQFTYDDNLYRLPSSIDVTTVAGPMATRADGFNSVTLGGNGRWFSDIQALTLNIRADDNHFLHNDSLDNVSGKGNLDWDWRLGTYWSGQVGVSYLRELSNFANTGYYSRDVVERGDYFGNVRYQLGPHWALYGGFIGADTSHTAVPEQPYDFRSKAGNGGVEFATSSSNTVSLDYRYTNAVFPQQFTLNGAPFNSNYLEQTAQILVKYVFSVATELDASAGYLKRDYPESSFAAFSGDIWRVALQWQPTDQLQWVLKGWHQLSAYVDAESDYFVSNGVSLSPTWIATQTLKLSLTISREDHDYIGSSPSAVTFVSRRDKLTSGQAGLIYAPKEFLIFNLTGRYDKRDSNQAQFQFNDTLATASVTYKIRP